MRNAISSTSSKVEQVSSVSSLSSAFSSSHKSLECIDTLRVVWDKLCSTYVRIELRTRLVIEG